MTEPTVLNIVGYMFGCWLVFLLICWATIGGGIERFAKRHGLMKGDRDE